jgi:hypothetical protein
MGEEDTNSQIKYLLLLEPSVESLSKKVFFMFKPKDVLKGESFDLKIILTNKSGTHFPGGKIHNIKLIQGRDANGITDELPDQIIPAIAPNENCIINFNNWHAFESGVISIELMVNSFDNKQVGCYQKLLGSNKLELCRGTGRWIDFIHVSNKSEIQQKYTNNILIILTLVTVIYYVLTIFIKFPILK